MSSGYRAGKIWMISVVRLFSRIPGDLASKQEQDGYKLCVDIVKPGKKQECNISMLIFIKSNDIAE